MESLSDLECRVKAILGETSISLEKLQAIGEGSIIELDQLAGEHVSVEINGRKMLKGEVVVVGERLGIRVLETAGV